MKKLIVNPFLALSVVAVLLLTSCEKNDDAVVTPPTPVVKPNIEFYALSVNNQLTRYNANASQTAISQVVITGLQANEIVLGIDFRPATGELFALGNTSRLYVVNPVTGVARVIGATSFTPGLSGTVTGFDFNPTVDRIRVVTNSGQNLRLNPETGAVAATDASINPTAAITGAAYTNSFAGAATTVLFDIDGGKLYQQNPPNNGTLVEVGSLGLGTGNTSGDMDISPDNTVALASIIVNGVSSLYQIDLATAKTTNLGPVTTPIVGIAFPSLPVAYSTDAGNNLLIFNLTTPGTPVSKAITGLQAGENVLGIDIRPATGQLYALGSSSRLYAINMSSGVATAVSAVPFTTILSGTSFGFDFNPTVDRIRVVSNTGQNMRLDPNTGLIAAVDASLNPGTPMVSAAAYTNNFAGATTTSLLVIDPSTDKLYTQIPPNNGTLVEVGNLGIDVVADNGFDIGGTSNKAYALLTVGTTTKIYSINLSTGAATAVADFPGLARGFAVGLGF